jgi:hypothetical protein
MIVILIIYTPITSEETGNMSELGELGCGGRAPKTSDGYGNAILQFNKFVDHTRALNKGIVPKKIFKYIQDCTAEDIGNEMTYRQFAFYLGVQAVKKVTNAANKGEPMKENQDGEPLAISTALQYLSNYQNAILGKFKDQHSFFDQFKDLKKGDSIPWVKKIRDELRNTMEVELILAGIPVVLKAKGVSREVMMKLMYALIHGGNHLFIFL